MSNWEDIRATLAAARAERGLTLRQLARATGLSASSLCDYEGDMRMPDVDQVTHWAAGPGYDLALTPTPTEETETP